MKSLFLVFILLIYLLHFFVYSSNRDFYKILNISKQSNLVEIKKSYRKLVKQLHPDKNQNDKNGEKKFQDLLTAYQVLSNPDKRKKYDLYGESSLQGNEESGQSFGSFFNNFDYDNMEFKLHKDNYYYFDDGKGQNLEMFIEISLKEFYIGANIKIIRQALVAKLIPGEYRKCNCRQEYKPEIIRDGIYAIKQETICDECHNFQLYTEDILLTVNIKPGMTSNMAILFDGYGELSPEDKNKSGDLIIKLRAMPNKKFERIENDLYINVTITLQSSLIGFNFEIEHLDGHIVNIKRDKITKIGDILKIENEGMPVYNCNELESSKNKGCLYVTFDIDFPKQLSFEEKIKIKNILNQSNEIKCYNGLQ